MTKLSWYLPVELWGKSFSACYVYSGRARAKHRLLSLCFSSRFSQQKLSLANFAGSRIKPYRRERKLKEELKNFLATFQTCRMEKTEAKCRNSLTFCPSLSQKSPGLIFFILFTYVLVCGWLPACMHCITHGATFLVQPQVAARWPCAC